MALQRSSGSNARIEARIAAREQRRFVELLLDAPKPNKALKRAAAAHAKLTKG